ncbi:1,2-phenylacetyl-CoA epoxidase subunit PaaC [Ornithinibacillus halophilus]|uniref:Ring-1,2-phenylacetyl-CoA epoxidase subunit PaaC n=1 Tax=Ornithinibacillus halophilus TaxID=930117 RepID=A0A1M5GAU7_9BACI|nr:1,2-phenylacetyl-CoA epoxidase subunit PaaC [Ornithinibacillus halophilus]SHG00798.1 ring-1,2-phenylacetyl-CoA epoxidase subunit PaaC [Ornithinibacillus halophilus]
MIESAEQAKKNSVYLNALKELLYQLADDDFIISFRGSEWLGLAPHIEEDVAFSSITQNTMGHAAMYYHLLEDLGEGEADAIAHDRKPEDRRNGIYLEKRNGEGTYLEEPYYDWALAVVRNYFYESFKKVKLEAIAESCSYKPLVQIVNKVLMEQTYHLAHWKLWVSQLQQAPKDAKERIENRVEEAWDEFGDVLQLGKYANEMVEQQLMISEDKLKEMWTKEISSVLVSYPEKPLGNKYGSGREGDHTADLDQAIKTFSEVYFSDKEAVW